MTDLDVKAQSFTLTVDGVNHTMVLPLAIMHTIRLRTEVGWSQPQLLEYLKDPDLDTFAACLFMACLQAGEVVTFEQIANGLNYDSKIAIGVAEDDLPES